MIHSNNTLFRCNLDRFWAVQILFVGTPSVLFMVYAMHVMTTIPVEEPKKEEEKGKEGKKDSLKDKAGESTSSDTGKYIHNDVMLKSDLYRITSVMRTYFRYEATPGLISNIRPWPYKL